MNKKQHISNMLQRKNFREKRISETSLFAAVPKFEQEINLGREISEIE